MREYEEILSRGDKADERSQDQTPSAEEIMDGDPDEANVGSAVQLALLQESEEV